MAARSVPPVPGSCAPRSAAPLYRSASLKFKVQTPRGPERAAAGPGRDRDGTGPGPGPGPGPGGPSLCSADHRVGAGGSQVPASTGTSGGSRGRLGGGSSTMSVSSPSDPESSPPTLPGPQTPGGGDTEPGEEKVCAVCGDRATGYHFHVMSCEGGFFRWAPLCVPPRRSINKGVRFTCPFTRSCPVTKAKRRQCQACRLQKCLDVGMRKDMIMSEEALRQRRALRGQRRRDPPGGLTAEQQQLITILIAAHQRTFDSSFSQFTHYRPAVRLYLPGPRPQTPQEPGAPIPWPPSPSASCLDEDVLPDVFSMLPHFADLSTFMIQQVISFAKEIPAFRMLPIDDQISLLKGSTLEICQIQFNTVFNAQTKAWECGQHCYTIQDGALAGFQQIYLEPLLKFHISLRQLQLHEAEYVLLQAMLLFSPDHASITERDSVDRFQEQVALTLKSYIDHQHPMPRAGRIWVGGSPVQPPSLQPGGCIHLVPLPRFLYAKLLLLLTELKTLKVENTRQILHIQDLSSMTPLLSETSARPLPTQRPSLPGEGGPRAAPEGN
ncbi:LOW QUALITY PROTEIN: nuclear receptor subfamily 1 group I member 3 [Porphyrio hochstetteri]